MLITLLSDLGNNSPFNGIAEATIRRNFPGAEVIVMSNEVKPLNTVQSSYFWKCSIGNYPTPIYHIALTDLVMSLPAHVMICEYEGAYYFGIDNGLMTTTFSHVDIPFFISKKVAGKFKEYIDIICESILLIAASGLNQDTFVSSIPQRIYDFPKVIERANAIDCLIIFIDNYENIVTNLKKEEFNTIRKGRDYTIQLLGKEQISQIHDRFIGSESGGLSAYFNEFGFLQISMRAKSMRTASILGYNEFLQESAINNYISIVFR